MGLVWRCLYYRLCKTRNSFIKLQKLCFQFSVFSFAAKVVFSVWAAKVVFSVGSLLLQQSSTVAFRFHPVCERWKPNPFNAFLPLEPLYIFWCTCQHWFSMQVFWESTILISGMSISLSLTIFKVASWGRQNVYERQNRTKILSWPKKLLTCMNGCCRPAGQLWQVGQSLPAACTPPPLPALIIASINVKTRIGVIEIMQSTSGLRFKV